MCPYTNKHSGKSKVIRKEVWKDLKDWEKEELNMEGLTSSDDSD